jgi:hypothetical protein
MWQYVYLLWYQFGTHNLIILRSFRLCSSQIPKRARISQVSIATDYGLDYRGIGVRLLARARDFLSGSGAPPASYPFGAGGCFRGGKAAEKWSYPLNLMYCRVKNTWMCTFTPPYVLIGTTLPFLPFSKPTMARYGLLPNLLAAWGLYVVNRGKSADSKITKMLHLLTLSSCALLEKPPVVQLLKNFPAFYGTRRSITVLIRALQWSLSWARSSQSIPPILPLIGPL